MAQPDDTEAAPSQSRNRGRSSATEDETVTVVANASRPGGQGRIGNYVILGVLGEGGMGTVFEAEQQNPRRTVALKVIRGAQRVSESRVRLFQREAQALGRLKHPGIAAIYEAGRTEDGEHFFAMELVRGNELLAHLTNRPASSPLRNELRLRLGLFLRICEAVHYAHQRGVIHRDLKPANILVTEESTEGSSLSSLPGLPRVKVLDFGLARIVDAEDQAASFTQTGRVQGTLPYMSPEQISGHAEEIDVRTDVYSLGVVLYQLLTGKLPYDLAEATLKQSVRAICVDPPRPMKRSWRGDGRLDRDLITITLKCLAKERSHRYQTVFSLKEDVERFLGGSPILARPAGPLYPLVKMVKRHPAVSALSAAVFALLLVAGITSWRAARARELAEANERSAQQMSGFLLGLFDAAEPSSSTISPEQTLRNGSAWVRTQLEGHELSQALLLDTIGSVQFDLGQLDQAERSLLRALEIRLERLDEDDPALAETRFNLGLVFREQGRLEEAEAMLRQSLAIRQAASGEDPFHLLESTRELARLLEAGGRAEEARPLWDSWNTMLDAQAGRPRGQLDLPARLSGFAAHLRARDRLAEARTVERWVREEGGRHGP